MVARATLADDARKPAERNIAVATGIEILGIPATVTLVCWLELGVPLAERNSPQRDRFITRR
jgi:hypothetical protein